MNRKVYFAGSIRGGREDAALYRDIIKHIQETDIVLTEHIGATDLNAREQGVKDQDIYNQDMTWLRTSDILIAECTRPSLGVGYELCAGEHYGKPCYIFYRPSETQLSAMLRGDAYFHVDTYETKEELFQKLDAILREA